MTTVCLAPQVTSGVAVSGKLVGEARGRGSQAQQILCTARLVATFNHFGGAVTGALQANKGLGGLPDSAWAWVFRWYRSPTCTPDCSECDTVTPNVAGAQAY